MKYFKLHNKSKCWWCGSGDLSGEHKMKKTELELLYGKVYNRGNLINHIRYKTESKGQNIQSSGSDRVKFERNLCIKCNGTKSQSFDLAYHRLIEYYYKNRKQIWQTRKIDLEDVFGINWKNEYLNVERYIGKHVGCRMAENGLVPTENLISFLDKSEKNTDLKIIFQIKPYPLEQIYDSIDSIFLGPANPINCSKIKKKGIVTSFSGWYTFAKFSWSYLHEYKILRNREIHKILEIDLVDYAGLEGIKFSLNEKTLSRDWSKILDKLEYYPYENGDKNIEHYKYVKNFKRKK